MTVVINLSTDIEAPIELVYDLARDLDLHQRSLAHTGEVAIGGKRHGAIDAGETVTWRARHFGIWWTLTSRITAAEPPVRFEDVQEAGPFAWFRHQHRFERTATGTRMTDHWEHASPFGPLGRIADRIALAGHLRRLLEQRNMVLKAEAERAAAELRSSAAG